MCEVYSQAVFDQETQSYFIESQLDETETEAPVKLDFQAEYLKCMGLDANDIDKIAAKIKSTYEQNTQHELNSQTDAETVIRPFVVTGNRIAEPNIDATRVIICAILTFKHSNKRILT